MGLEWARAWCKRCDGMSPFRPGSEGKGKVCIICAQPIDPRQKRRPGAPVKAKYGNKKTVSKIDGRVFDSRMEASRQPTLVSLENTGQITGLRYQVVFRLDVYGTQAVDALLEALEAVAAETGRPVPRFVENVRRSRQHICDYKADFVYTDHMGRFVVEDVKGYATKDYRLKKRLMVAAHNVEIVEPNRGGIQQRARGAGVRGPGTGSRLRGGR